MSNFRWYFCCEFEIHGTALVTMETNKRNQQQYPFAF